MMSIGLSLEIVLVVVLVLVVDGTAETRMSLPS
jgi:hypothetical protein